MSSGSNADRRRNVVVTMFLSLDGVMEKPENWHKQFHNHEAQQFKHDELFAADALLLGRKTYEIFADAWPSRTDEAGFADRMNGVQKYVVSSTLSHPQWTATSVLNDDLRSSVAGLTREPGGDLLVCGSRQLVQGLMQNDLVDEFRLLIDPIVLGTGERLFEDGIDQTSLTLKSLREFESGSVLGIYRPKDRHLEGTS